MTGKQINEARRLNRVFEQLEKDEMIDKVIKAYGESLFKIAELQQEIQQLKQILERRYRQ